MIEDYFNRVFVRVSGSSLPVYVPSHISSVKSLVDGNATDVTSVWTSAKCSTFIENSESDPNCIFGTSADAIDSIICRNAIVSIEYTIFHNQDSYSTITGVDIKLVVGDIVYTDDSTFVQSFEINFLDSADSSSISQANGNQVQR